jgi:3-oxoadipate enol-lactonase/4-carboxymuconolactone decarboxylase
MDTMTSFLQLPSDLNLHYRSDGAGDPLVLINALGTDLRVWDAVATQLAPYARLIRYDKRGHGLSSAPPAPYTIRDHVADLKYLLDALALERVNLVGISVGGLIAMQFALEQPGRVSRLILCDTDAKIGTAEGWEQRIAAVRAHGLEPMSAEILARWFAPAFKATHPAVWEGCRHMLARQPVEGYVGTCAALRDADLRDSVGAITVPVLVLAGREDTSVTVEAAQSLAERLGASFGVIEGSGHLPPVEQPQVVARRIIDFLYSGDRYARGMAIRRSVLGDAHVDRAEANKTPFDHDFQQFITEAAWGTAWARGGISRTTRHLITIAVLAALGKEHELAMHLRATRNSGVTLSELEEAFFQVAIYAGIPAANTAFSLAKRELTEHE